MLWAMLTDAALLARADDLELEDLTEPGNRHLLAAIRTLQETDAEVTIDAACQAYATLRSERGDALHAAFEQMRLHVLERLFVEQNEPYCVTWPRFPDLQAVVFDADLRGLRISADLRRRKTSRAA